MEAVMFVRLLKYRQILKIVPPDIGSFELPLYVTSLQHTQRPAMFITVEPVLVSSCCISRILFSHSKMFRRSFLSEYIVTPNFWNANFHRKIRPRYIGSPENKHTWSGSWANINPGLLFGNVRYLLFLADNKLQNQSTVNLFGFCFTVTSPATESRI